jgi:hypothetical protein
LGSGNRRRVETYDWDDFALKGLVNRDESEVQGEIELVNGG